MIGRRVTTMGCAIAVAMTAAVLIPAAHAATSPSASPSPTPVACNQPAGDPSPATDPTAWRGRDLGNLGCATQRQQDQLSNPAFVRMWAVESGEGDPGTATANAVQQLEQPTRPRVNGVHDSPGATVTDPFRNPEEWMQAGRGFEQTLTMVATTGAYLNARLYVPHGSGPFPGVVMIPGLEAYNEVYEWLGEGLAESGYMVLIPDPQGQGDSENLPHNPDGSINCSASGCPNTPTNDFPEVTSGLDFLLSTPASPDADARGANAVGALTYNPAWASLDPARVGVAGHSLGAIAVTSVGQDDPRVRAVVSFDNLDGNVALAPGATIHAPTLYFGVDYAFPSILQPNDPSNPPDPELHAEFAYRQTKAAGVDTMLVVPRASTHYEFSYQPFPASLQASRDGERTVFYYTLAWLDRYLRGNQSATTRLTATVFDGSADASSIGAGTFDPAAAAADPTNPAAGNVPYKIAGMCVADLLSFYYHSDFWLDGGQISGVDMRSRGCPASG